MAMSKKDFVTLGNHARALFQSTMDGEDRLTCSDVAKMLIRFCKAQNPAFNADRWLDYVNGQCGPNGGKIKK